MKNVKLLIMIAVVVVLVPGGAIAQHYYGGGKAIPLRIDSTRVTIRFNDTTTVGQQQDQLSTIDRIEALLPDDHVIDDFLTCSLSRSQGYDAFLDSLETLPGVDLVEPYYRSGYDSAFLVGHQFCVAFQKDMTKEKIDAINESYGVVIDHPVAYMPNVFVLRNSKKTGMRMLELANMYYNLDATRYSHPNFSVRPVLSSYNLYDHYADYQPHTKKVIGSYNDASVWDFAGLESPIIVAVIDDGVTSHEDLPPERVLPGYDFANADGDPTPGVAQAHGMACAGIISASHTTDSVAGQQSSSGMISLAPNVLIMPLKIFYDNGVGTEFGDIPASAISYAWQNGADILSNSWGYPDPSQSYDVLNDAIEEAFLYGRGGRGCPVIFASGNAAQWWLGQVAYPANLPTTLAVGATELDDNLWYYSQHGPTLDLVAPSGDVYLQGDVWSLDQTGTPGWNPTYMSDCPPGNNDNDFDCRFGGTSAACPVVSGTAALALSRKPDLDHYWLYLVLKRSAVTDLDWGTITPPDYFHGFGRVDAFRAILSIARGDANNDAQITVGDIGLITDYLFITHDISVFQPHWLLADANCNGAITIGDVAILQDHLFISRDSLPIPCFEYGD